MNKNSRTFGWTGVVVGLIIIIAIALFAWYLYLHNAQNRLDTVSSGRGFGQNTEVFGTPIGALSVVGVERGKGTVATATLPAFAQASAAPSSAPYYSGSSTIARFTDIQNGNIYDVDLSNGSITRVTNTLIAKVGEVVWVDASRVLLRAVDDAGHITTLNAVISGSTTPKILTGTYLEQDIASLAASPDGTMLARLVPTTKGVDLIRSKPDGTLAKRLWSSGVRGWTLSWIKPRTIFATSRASAGVSGSLYGINADTGDTTAYIVDVPGLTARMSPKNANLVYSASYSDRTVLFYRAASSTDAVRLPLKTLAEKCVWSTTEADTLYCAVPRSIPTNVVYPDDWYRGEFHTSDDWFIIHLADNTVVPLSGTEFDTIGDVDVSAPTIDLSGKHIVFIDAKTNNPFIITIAKQ